MYTSSRLISASSIERDKVRNPQGEDIGYLRDLMVDTRSGRIEYAVLSVGGLLGMGGKYFAVPWQAISVDRDSHMLVINVQKDELENAPGFDQDNWPDMAEKAFRDNISTFYRACCR